MSSFQEVDSEIEELEKSLIDDFKVLIEKESHIDELIVKSKKALIRLLLLRKEIYSLKGEMEKSLELSSLCKDIYPENPESWISYAHALRLAGRQSEEISGAFEKAIEFSDIDKNFILQSNVEFLYFLLEDPHQQKEKIEKVIIRFLSKKSKRGQIDATFDVRLIDRLLKVGINEEIISDLGKSAGL